MVRSYFENYDSTTWKIIGIFTDKKQAEDISIKWDDFYIEKQNLFIEPRGWKPSEKDIEYDALDWYESEEYHRRCSKYSDIRDFKEIIIEEHDLNMDKTFNDELLNEDLISLMKQWDRNYKLDKIVK